MSTERSLAPARAVGCAHGEWKSPAFCHKMPEISSSRRNSCAAAAETAPEFTPLMSALLRPQRLTFPLLGEKQTQGKSPQQFLSCTAPKCKATGRSMGMRRTIAPTSIEKYIIRNSEISSAVIQTVSFFEETTKSQWSA